MNGYVRKSVDPAKMRFKKLEAILNRNGMHVELDGGILRLNVIGENDEKGFSFVISEPSKLSLNKKLFKWKCNAHDKKHSTYHPDYEGSCGKVGHESSLEKAKQACIDHKKKCQFGNENFTIVFNGGSKRETFEP